MSKVIVMRAHKRVLVPYSGQIRQLWPGADTVQHNGDTYAVIQHGPREQMIMRVAGIEIPPPILEYYDWEKGKPFQVQRATAALATSHKRGYILNDMGTGKTRAALWSWRYLNRMRLAQKLLIVAPLSTLKFVWARECALTLPGVNAVVVHGTPTKRRKMLADSNADIFIINHDGLKVVLPELMARKDIDTLVIDEIAVYRNRSQRTNRMIAFAARFEWAWGMSGRPMPNAPTDVFYQCKIITPGLNGLPQFWRHAQSMLMFPLDSMGYRWAPKDGAVERAMSWMQPAVRFTLEDVTELPENIVRTIDVDLSDEQASAYRKLANEFAIMIKQKQITAANAGVAMHKLLQLGAGYVYTTNPSYVTLDSEPRQKALLELIEAVPHKVLVFAPWKHLIDNLSVLLTDEKIEHAVIFGETSLTKRAEIFADFQNSPKYHVLLAHPATLHHGVTLTAASTCIWYSPVMSLEVYEQACARIRRYGQKEKTQFLHIQATEVERRIYRLLRSKQRLQDKFLAMMEAQTEASEVSNGEDDKTQWQADRQSQAG